MSPSENFLKDALDTRYISGQKRSLLLWHARWTAVT